MGVGTMEKVLDFIRESKAFIRESKAELLLKVTWPTKKQVWSSTLVVIFLTGVVSLYLFVVDIVLTAIFTRFLG
jgi:preprotein translocase subunit SecE